MDESNSITRKSSRLLAATADLVVEDKMPFDDELANRVRKILEKIDGVSEKKMFGGLCFLVISHMALGLVNEDLMIRVGPDSYKKMLSQPYVRKMDFTGKPLKGFLYVGAKGTESDKDLRKWVLKGVEFARSLPAKNKRLIPLSQKSKYGFRKTN